MARLVVTGCAGFIGSRITSELLKAGHVVVGVETLNDLLYSRDQKASRLSSLNEHVNFHPVVGESHSIDDLVTEFRGADCIINEAGLPGQVLSWDYLEQYCEANLLAAERFMRAAIQAEVSRFVQASTSSVYGKFAISDEAGTLNPCSPYGVTKLAAEHLLRTYADDRGIELQILRYFSVYGPGQRPDMAIHRFLKAAHLREPITIYGDGSQIRDFTYVDDIVQGTLRAAEMSGSNTYNLCSGRPLALKEVVQLCIAVVGSDVPVILGERTRGDQDTTAGDNSAAQRELGFVPKTRLSDGIAAQYESMLKGN